MRRIAVILLLFLCGALTAQERFVNYSAADGLSSNTVYAIVQDLDGVLWVGTRNGLNRFDGAQFSAWQQELPAARVTSLAVDGANRLWIGTTAGLCVKDGSHFIPGPKGHIRAIRVASDGAVWVATLDGRLLKLALQDTEIGIESTLPYSIVNFEGDYPYQQIYEDSKGVLWLGGRIVHCQYVEDGAVHFRFDPHCSMGSYAEADGKLYSFEDYNSALCIIAEGEELKKVGKLPLGHVLLFTDSKGRLWAAGSYGLGLVDTARPEASLVYRHAANDPETLASSELYCIFEDRQGNIWTGGDNGLSVLCPALLPIKNILPSKRVTALMQGHDGCLWAGTADSGAYAIDPKDGTMRQYDYRPAGRANEGHVSCLYEDSGGAVYIGLWAGCGFNIVEGGKVRRGAITGTAPQAQLTVFEGNLFHANWIADFLEDGSGRFWVATWEGVGINEWDRKTGKTLPARWLSPFKYPTPEVDSSIYLSSRLASRLIEDAAGNLAYGTTEAGLNLIDRNTGLVQKYLPNPADSLSIPDKCVTDLCLAPDGKLWVATPAGLWTPSGERLLEGKPVQSVQADGRGRLWAGTEEGLYFIGPDGNIGLVKKGLGFPADIYTERASCLLADGSLAFGGPAGAVIFHPDSLLAAAGPKVLLSECTLDGEKLEFAFSSANLPLASALKYRYRLDGADDAWVEARYPHLQARYQGLSPGKYTLRIECSDLFGRWTGDALTRSIQVKAPLLLRWPFLLLYLFLAVAAVRLALYLHERKLRRDNARLEKAVQEKTARIQEELDTRNRFFSLISHDLRGPVSGVQLLSEELVGKADQMQKDKLRFSLEKLRDAASGASSLLENLLLWSLTQKNLLEPVLREENAKEIVDEAIATVKEKAAAKGVCFEVDAPGTVLTDRNMLTTCLRNLLENAVRYSPEGGIISVRCEKQGITVLDKGPGMDPEFLETLARPGRLGLVICKDLLGKMGYSLHARNPQGGGCEMTIKMNGYAQETEHSAR